MSLAGCQINQIDVNFHLQKDNIWSKKDKGVESALPHAN